MVSVDKSFLANLDPISSLSPGRQEELAGLCFVETVSRDLDPFRMNIVRNSQDLYLLDGELALNFADGRKQVMRGGTFEARQPIDGGSSKLNSAQALTDLKIVRIDTDLLDIMMTWDQLTGYEQSAGIEETSRPPHGEGRGVASWMGQTGTFSADKLQSGAFSQLPPANVEEMFHRMTSETVSAGQVIIFQGGEGDFYYLIEKGIAEVKRTLSATQTTVVLAELHEGEAFGEEALVSENKRNATVVMKTDGVLLRLKKADFIELMQAPLLAKVSLAQAEAMVASEVGAIWLDVRFPSEYRADHMPGAINIPLNEIRSLMSTLDTGKEYITYCQSGRRSSAAAFILAQKGFKVSVLEHGIRGVKPS